MVKKKHKGNIIILIAAIIIVLGAIIYMQDIQYQEQSQGELKKVNIAPVFYKMFQGDYRTIFLKLPAVNVNNTGVSASLEVNAIKGYGNVFLDVNNVLSKEDTQHSVRMAAEFAKEHEKLKKDGVDLFYSIRAFAPVIEGPSAGAAFAVASIAILRNKTLDSSVMITGMLNHDGTIGPSGRIIEKARAAKEAGAKMFLVPVGSLASLKTNYTESEYCQMWGGYEYCQPEFTPQIINVTEEAGLPVIEVATIDEALKYFNI